MSISVEGQKCPVCHAYLFDDDDVVYCPVCGAPHHRDCWNAVGHCGLESLHGTEKQYDKARVSESEEKTNEPVLPETEETEKPNVCVKCRREFEADAHYCPFCRLPLVPKERLDGGVSPDQKTEEGVTAKEIAEVVAVNPQYYVPKMFSLGGKKRVSWNWAAFIMPSAWLCYRKNYRIGILVLLASFSGSLLTVPLSIGSSSAVDPRALALAAVGGAITLLCRVLLGMFGNYIYRERVISTALEIKNAEDSEEAEIIAENDGGVNLLAMAVVLLIEYLLPQIIATFLML